MTISQSPRRRRGFTLVEVLLVLVILVILGTLAVTAYGPIQERANTHAAEAQIGLFKTSLGVFQLDNKRYPTTDQGLESLREAPSDLSNPDNWNGPYLEVPVPLDPWDQPYQYESPGKYNTTSYDLWSFGPDMTDGTEDDIGNWTEQ